MLPSDNIILGQMPPQSVEMEKAVLGACMIESEAFDRANLKPEHFYVPAHQKVFKAMQSLVSKSRPIDILTVVEELGSEIESIGGSFFISQLTSHVVNSANLEPHAKTILEKFTKRELIKLSTSLLNDAYGDRNPTDLIDELDTKLSSLRLNESVGYKDISQLLFESFKSIQELRLQTDKLTGVTSGFSQLDAVTCGWQPSDLVILAARPSVGKTAFMLNLARNATVPVGIFSLEMSDRQLIHRMLAAESAVYLWNIKNGKLDDEQMKNLYEKGIQPLSKKKIFVDQTSSIKLPVLKARAKRMVEKDGVKIIFIDYLQLMQGGERYSRKDLEIGAISAGLKGLAKDLNIPIIALSQLNRETDGEPKLSNLRESGAIEQDADMVMFLWKPSDEEVLSNPSLVEVCNMKIEKNRNGSLETFLCDFKKDTQRWTDVKILDKRSFMPVGNSWKPYKE